jgi:hypothetical protein
MVKKCCCQHRYILNPLAKRGYGKADGADSKIQIVPECLLTN